MAQLTLSNLRARIDAMDFERGTPEQIAAWRAADAESRANLIIEGMRPEPDEDGVFALMMAGGVPPAIASQLILELVQAQAADRIAA